MGLLDALGSFGQGASNAVAALKAYRQSLLKRGKVLEAATVLACIALLRKHRVCP